jgi:hypothetical protein
MSLHLKHTTIVKAGATADKELNLQLQDAANKRQQKSPNVKFRPAVHTKDTFLSYKSKWNISHHS